MNRQGALQVLRALVLPSLALSLGAIACSGAQGADDAQSDEAIDHAKKGAGDTDGDDTTAGSDTSAGSSGSCASDGSPFDEKALKSDLSYLASKDLAGRVPGSAGDKAARTFIENRFTCLGLKPGGTHGKFQQPFTNKGGEDTANVIGIVPGSDPDVGSDIIVVGAHHDHFGTGGGKGLRLGANDNASGVVGVLALAQAVKQRAQAPKRTIVFMTFGSEETLTVEPYVEGSAFYVKSPTAAVPLSHVVYMINFDMIGTYSKADEVLAMGTFPKTPATAIVKSLAKDYSDLDVTLGDVGGKGDSDFYSFCKSGVPFVGFYTDDPNCYHKSCDTEDRIDYPHLSQIAKLASELTLKLADSTTDLAAWRKKAAFKDLGCY